MSVWAGAPAALLVAAAVVLAAPPPRRSPAVAAAPSARPRRRRPPAVALDMPAVLDTVVAQLRAGVAPARAWPAACDLHGTRAPGTGAPDPSDPAQAPAAAAWALAAGTGAGLAEVLAALAEGGRQQDAANADLAAALAGPRATTRLLTALPLGGLALGAAVGAHPLGVLVHSAPGRVCGVSGSVLLLAGRAWSRALVHRVERHR